MATRLQLIKQTIFHRLRLHHYMLLTTQFLIVLWSYLHPLHRSLFNLLPSLQRMLFTSIFYHSHNACLLSFALLNYLLEYALYPDISKITITLLTLHLIVTILLSMHMRHSTISTKTWFARSIGLVDTKASNLNMTRWLRMALGNSLNYQPIIVP